MKYRKYIWSFIITFQLWLLIFSNYGLYDWYKNHIQIIKYKKELIELEKQKNYLLMQIEKLAGPDIDKDLLEYQMRKVISYVRTNEDIYFWKNESGAGVIK